MQKTVITFGIIAGLIVVVLFMAHFSLTMGEDGAKNFDTAQLLGYISMIVALSMVFIGVKQFRDRQLGGKITFGKAFKVGLLISLIAAGMYVIYWMVYFNMSEAAQAYPAQYLEHMKKEWAASGMSADEIAQKTAGFEKNIQVYISNPIVMAGMTLMEILPVGLIVSLLSALILKRK